MSITHTNVTIMVRDMDRSVTFYQSIGFTLANRWGNHYAQLQAPGITLGIHPASGEILHGSGNVSIGFTSDDFEQATTLLKELSIPADPREEEGGRFLHFTDPDGTQLYFIKPKWN